MNDLEEIAIIVGHSMLSARQLSEESLEELIPATILTATRLIEAGFGKDSPIFHQRPAEIVSVFDERWVNKLREEILKSKRLEPDIDFVENLIAASLQQQNEIPLFEAETEAVDPEPEPSATQPPDFPSFHEDEDESPTASQPTVPIPLTKKTDSIPPWDAIGWSPSDDAPEPGGRPQG